MRLNVYLCLFFSLLLMNLASAQDVNLALNKTASSSSNESDDLTPNHAFDGAGFDTEDGIPGDGKARNGSGVEYDRWSSDFGDPQWIAVDLGAMYLVNEVRLYWEVANGQDFTIDVSEDNSTWVTIETVTGNSSGTFYNAFSFSPGVAARYVRMHGTARNTAYGYSLYEFEVWGPNSTLPITLADLTLQKINNAVKLSWDAAMDAESRFKIQRSGDGKNFSTIGTLHFANGTKGVSNQYSFVDESPLPGTSYYRLQYTETGERTLYSEALSVRFTDDRAFAISPNPVAGSMIHIALDQPRQNNLTLRLLSITGKVIDQQKVNAAGNTIQMKLNRSLSAGTYILQVLEKNQSVRSRQIVISR